MFFSMLPKVMKKAGLKEEFFIDLFKLLYLLNGEAFSHSDMIFELVNLCDIHTSFAMESVEELDGEPEMHTTKYKNLTNISNFLLI
jgi:hypothetical protein